MSMKALWVLHVYEKYKTRIFVLVTRYMYICFTCSEIFQSMGTDDSFKWAISAVHTLCLVIGDWNFRSDDRYNWEIYVVHTLHD